MAQSTLCPRKSIFKKPRKLLRQIVSLFPILKNSLGLIATKRDKVRRMNLTYHTAGVPYIPKNKGSCLDPVFTKACRNLKSGYVSYHHHKNSPSISCLHGQSKALGICWPGGASGYNLQSYLDG